MALYDPNEVPNEVTTDFTLADVLAWARTKPADARYEYTDRGNCALCQFLRETFRASAPDVSPHFPDETDGHWRNGDGPRVGYPAELEPALRADDEQGSPSFGWTFGKLVERLERVSA